MFSRFCNIAIIFIDYWLEDVDSRIPSRISKKCDSKSYSRVLKVLLVQFQAFRPSLSRKAWDYLSWVVLSHQAVSQIFSRPSPHQDLCNVWWEYWSSCAAPVPTPHLHRTGSLPWTSKTEGVRLGPWSLLEEIWRRLLPLLCCVLGVLLHLYYRGMFTAVIWLPEWGGLSWGRGSLIMTFSIIEHWVPSLASCTS